MERNLANHLLGHFASCRDPWSGSTFKAITALGDRVFVAEWKWPYEYPCCRVFVFFVGRNQESSIKMDVFLPSQGQEVIFWAGDWDLFLSLGTSPHPRQVLIRNDCWLPDFSVSIWRGLPLFSTSNKFVQSFPNMPKWSQSLGWFA